MTEVDEDDKDIKGIPQFWLTALKNHAIIGEQITEKDEEVRVLRAGRAGQPRR